MGKTFKPKTPEQIEEELNELTDMAINQIDSFFTSKESIIEHLQFLAQFHNFSVRNMALINKQFEGAEAVGSFLFWRGKGVSVKKGEKGIKILVPKPVHFFKRSEQSVQLKNATEDEKKLIQEGKIKTSKKTFFSIGNVFDYSQTNAREKGLEVSEIFGQFQINQNVENAPAFMRAFEKIAEDMGVKILDEPYQELGVAKGAFYRNFNSIALNPRNTEAENIQVMIHELAHAEMHNVNRNKDRGRELSTNEKEFQAEMTAYVVASRYGIQIDNFSIPYLANWTKNATLQDKEQLIDEVKQTATKFINTIDEHLQKELLLEKSNTLEQGQTIAKIGFVEYGALSQSTLKTLKFSELEATIQSTLAENAKKEDYLKQLAPVFQNNELTQDSATLINQVLKENVHVFDVEKVSEPQILVQWSEHENIRDSTMYRFAEINETAGEIAFDHEHNVSDGTYYKTRYALLIPEGKEISLVRADRLDLGDGEFKDMHHQLLRERRLTNEQTDILEEDLKNYYQPQKFEALLSHDLNAKTIESSMEKNTKDAAATIKEKYGNTLRFPIMKVHGHMNEYQEFGAANQIGFTEKGVQKFDYTVAFTINNDVKIVSSTFDLNHTITPLHDLEKFGKLAENELNTLSVNWHTVFQREEDKYLEGVAPRLRKEINKVERKANTRARQYELER